MPTADYSSYHQQQGTVSDGNKYDNFVDAVQATVNGLDSNNIASLLISKLTGGYTAYTPTWTASGTAPAIGNAVVVAQYMQIGKLVHAYGRITFGTTSTFGTGTYSFALPVTASTNALAAAAAGTGQMFDISAGFLGLAEVFVATTTTQRFEFGATYLGTDTAAGATTPWTWANTDIISWNITYEAA